MSAIHNCRKPLLRLSSMFSLYKTGSNRRPYMKATPSLTLFLLSRSPSARQSPLTTHHTRFSSPSQLGSLCFPLRLAAGATSSSFPSPPMGNPPELYYKILNIPKDTSPQEIRTAYKNLVKKWHPDKHPPSSKPEAEARFKAISEAYEALLDQQENRAVFGLCNDGRAGERAGGAFGGGLGAGVGPRMERTRSDDFCTRSAPGTPAREFKKVYSSGNSGGRRAFAEFSSSIMRKAPPLERKLECTLEELCRGCKKEVKFTRDVVTKNGSIVKKEVTQAVVVKPGWRKGKQVVFEGMGDERPGCLPADAIFTVSEKKHPTFKRVGNDLVLKAEVPLAGALTGWSFSFRLLSGKKVSLAFQDEVVCPGLEKVIRGEGMPIPEQKGARGDLKVKLEVVFPKELTDEQRAGLAEILKGSC